MNSKLNSRLICILRFSAFTILIGRAWQHIFWDASFRALLWNENLLKPIIEGIFNINWMAYVSSSENDLIIQWSIKGIGIFYLIGAILSLFIKKNNRFLFRVYPIYSIFLCILAGLYWKEQFLRIGQLFEYSIQISTPILLWLALYKDRIKQVVTVALMMTALTFICHGLYALGFYPRPGKFIDMTINILPVSEGFAHNFLFIAGVLDMVVAIMIFIKPTRKTALLYCVFWGLLTAFARVCSELSLNLSFLTLHQSLHETLFRLSHGLIPLFLYYYPFNTFTKNFQIKRLPYFFRIKKPVH